MEDPYCWFVKQSHVPASSDPSEAADLSPTSPSRPISGTSSVPARWVPLRRSDQKSLEAALLASEVGLGDVEHVHVDGGRAEVKIADRCYVDRFGIVPPPAPKPVRRVLWLRHTGGIDGTWQPYSEQTDEAIEFAYKLLIESAGDSAEAKVQTGRFAREVPLNDALNSVVHLQFTLSVDEFTGAPQWSMLAEERQCSSVESPKKAERASIAWLQEWADAALNIKDSGVSGVKRTPVKRGYGEVPLLDGCQEEEMLNEDIARLVVYVHGVAVEETESESGRLLRRNLHRSQLQAIGVEEDMDGNWGPEDKMSAAQHQPKTEVIEVFWDTNLQLKSRIGALSDQLERTSLPSMTRVREMMNRATHGFLLYSRHRDDILLAVKESVEAAVSRFMSHHPEWSGEILLAGHSLGGLALFELLREEKLSCKAEALYALGSPIGQLLEIDGEAPLPESKFPGGARFFNVYHPLDPVGCRTEPLLMPELAARPPAKVPTERFPENSANLQNLQAFLNKPNVADVDDNLSDCGSITSSTRASSVSGKQEERAARLAEFIGLRLHGRLDWVLQSESGCEVTCFEDLPDAALTSHLSYMRSFDMAAFMHGSCIQILQPAEPDRPIPVAKVFETKVNIFGQTVQRNPDAGSFGERKTFWERASSSTAAGLKKFADSASRKLADQSGASEVANANDAPRASFWGKARTALGAAKSNLTASPEKEKEPPLS